MQTAYIHAADLRFPDRCVRCNGTATTTHEICASRGVDLWFVAWWEFLPVPVPVCLRCKRRRRASGLAMYGGMLLFILIGSFVALVLAMEGWPVSAAALGAMVVAVAIGVRFRGDAFLEWSSVGIIIDLLRGEGAPLRMQFRRAASFTAWRAANPAAALTPGNLFRS